MAVDGAAADEDVRASPRAAPEHQARKLTRIAGRDGLLSPRQRPKLQAQQSATPMNNTRRAPRENDVRASPRVTLLRLAMNLTAIDVPCWPCVPAPLADPPARPVRDGRGRCSGRSSSGRRTRAAAGPTAAFGDAVDGDRYDGTGHGPASVSFATARTVRDDGRGCGGRSSRARRTRTAAVCVAAFSWC